MGMKQNSLARETALEILIAVRAWSSSIIYPTSAATRAMLRHIEAMRRQRYGRGRLTPAQGHDPDVLELQMRRAGKTLDPPSQEAAQNLWRQWVGGWLPAKTWERIESRKTSHARTLEFVGAASDITVESLLKRLQRERRRRRQRGQQTI
jgi:hypothetical protein